MLRTCCYFALLTAGLDSPGVVKIAVTAADVRSDLGFPMPHCAACNWDHYYFQLQRIIMATADIAVYVTCKRLLAYTDH